MKHHSYDMMHIMIWLAAVFCSVYVAILFYYLVMPISHWVTWTDVYPEKKNFEIGEPIVYISDIFQHKKTNYKFIDTMFCRDLSDSDGEFFRHDQQTVENYAEEPAMKRLQYRFPFNKPVLVPSSCFLNSTMIISTPIATTKAIKFNGKDRGHMITVTR